ncbi:hypothetical protein NDU88_005428 [Pleurodeles waltl]|uniref:Uncharacterized protein n=1 Tax=Pleurodeles waltl TaxID=8319 RepID=A0AAV7WCP1_PLEWA|nr:hypothetical protein NDU88_005428 [Pleurodeles waltl]
MMCRTPPTKKVPMNIVLISSRCTRSRKPARRHKRVVIFNTGDTEVAFCVFFILKSVSNEERRNRVSSASSAPFNCRSASLEPPDVTEAVRVRHAAAYTEPEHNNVLCLLLTISGQSHSTAALEARRSLCQTVNDPKAIITYERVRRGHGRQDGGRTLRVLWTPPSSARKAKPFRASSGNLRDPLWVYGCYETRGRKAGRNLTPGGTPEEVRPGGGRGVELVLLGTAPRGGELSRGQGLGLKGSAPREEPGAVIRAPRGAASAVGRCAAPGRGTRGAVPNAVGCWRVASATGPGEAEDCWTRGWALRLGRTPGAGPGHRRGAGEDSAGPAGPGLYPEPRMREDPGLPCP